MRVVAWNEFLVKRFKLVWFDFSLFHDYGNQSGKKQIINYFDLKMILNYYMANIKSKEDDTIASTDAMFTYIICFSKMKFQNIMKCSSLFLTQ